MVTPRTLARRLPRWQSLTLVLVGGLPPASSAGRPDEQRGLADKLRWGPGLANHPVHVAPSAAATVPEDWPLDFDGTITCLTCHHTLPSLQATAEPHLREFDHRQAPPTEFCAKCHGAGDDRSAAGLHWLAVRVAHVKPDPSGSDQAGGALDPQSRRCLRCHDGISAAESTNPTASSRQSFWDMQRNHPVGVPYDGRAARGAATSLRLPSLLPPKVRLPDGKVSCVSCHDLYARTSGLLAVPIEESALCFTCHKMK